MNILSKTLSTTVFQEKIEQQAMRISRYVERAAEVLPKKNNCGESFTCDYLA